MATDAPPRRTKQQLKYTSPRCELEDDEVLPSQSLEDHDERWRHMMLQAGPHQQDDTVLDLTNRPTTPQALKVGVPPQVARRIQELHVNFHSSFSLPEWLDVVCLLFSQLQHLYTRAKYEDTEEVSKETARMRRLYILYRLPDLSSIDGVRVTLVERQLARPSSPNGYKVKREDWVSDEAVEDASSDDDSSVLQNHGDAVEVNLFGVVKRVNADPPREEFDEPALVKPYEPKPEVKSVTKSVEQAHRIIQKESRVTKTASCGGLAAALVDSNPCVGSRRTTSLDEPHTVDYPSTPLTNDVTPPQTDKYAASRDVRSIDRNNVCESQANKRGNDFKSASTSKENNVKSPERRTEKRSATPEQKKSPSTSLSSPFPMQFRSKSFSGALPSRSGTQLPRKMSSPDLSPEKQTMDLQSSKAPLKNRGAKLLYSAQRPPPCPPGASRRVAIPEPRTRRRPWRSKEAIRTTSIVDEDDDDDDDYLSEDEDVIEHE